MPTPERFVPVTQFVINTPFQANLTPRPIPPRLGFYYDLPEDLVAAKLAAGLYFFGEGGEISEVGYRVFEGSGVVEFPRWKVKDKLHDTARKMFEKIVIPHLRKRFGIGEKKDDENIETPYRNDGEGQTPGNKPGGRKRVSNNGRKQKQAGKVD